ncbi:MAG: DegV family protein [Clostridia bacterium]|jgi:DegV family protein with EDD domain|nr:DegV family protein [Clostridia bacterium]MBT7122805.1 DegV family protein [Clostridia bacterium]
MRKIKFITDSTTDMPQSLFKQFDIDVVPLHVLLGEDDHLDDGGLKNEDLVKFADETGILPKSAAVNEFQFTEVFSKWIDKGFDIFCITLSSELSATYQAAMSAAQKFDADRICVVDSQNVSSGTAMLLLEACDMAQAGASLSDITEHVLSLRDKINLRFIVDTLKYLYMGGRCSKLASIMGSSLKIKPILEVKGGKIVPGDKLRGSNYINKYYDYVMQNVETIDPKRIFVTHCMFDGVDELKKRLEEDFGFNNVLISDTSATISTHCGPGTVGILYLNKQ